MTAERRTPRLLICDCAGSMTLDGQAIARGTGLTPERPATQLCRAEAARAQAALRSGDEVIIACGQEAAAFRDLAEDISADLGAEARLTCVDIRDRAGWADGPSGAKMAALIAGARVPRPGVPVLDVISEGVCLIYGAAEVALPAAARLSEALSVTVMLTDAEPVMVPEAEIDIVTGRIVSLGGALGGFELVADGFAPLIPAGRGAQGFEAPVNGAKSECDIVVDLSGGQPLVPAHRKRDGYLRADPGDALAVERALFDAAQLTGTFEKPYHIRFTESLCAHSRAGQTGCIRCRDLCPTGAITPDGDHVAIDPMVCAGCGACAAACPSGAALAEDPPTEALFAEMRAMARAYESAGGTAPRLLVHDAHGAEMIRLAARFGRGLPGDVIPIEVASLGRFGHGECLAGLGLGYAEVSLLAGPRTERAALDAEVVLAVAVVAGARPAAGPAGSLRVIAPDEPDQLTDALESAAPLTPVAAPILAAGGRRETVRLAARALADGAGGAGETPPPIPLPAGAPYGAVAVNADACTLCMACAGLCPTGALIDSPDAPELSFREEACIQCGLCATLCPERAITLEPRLDLSDAALSPRVLNAEEPFCCIECGAPFGVKSTIERISEKLGGSHWMFSQSDNLRLIQMCDDCRVRAQYHAEAAPFRMGTVPRPRTTADDLAEREAAKKKGDA